MGLMGSIGSVGLMGSIGSVGLMGSIGSRGYERVRWVRWVFLGFCLRYRPSTFVLRLSTFVLCPLSFDLIKKTPASVGLQEHLDVIVRLFT